MTYDKAWVISANMGLGHQRAVYPLRDNAHNGIRLFGDDLVSSSKERRLWMIFQKSYEFLSRTRNIPLVGPPLFSILEKVQNISPYYPFKDRSRPSFQVKSLYSLIKGGMGHGLSTLLSSKRLPVITSFYAAAIAVEELTDLPVYCIICDADINRVWVSKDPKKSRIVYFVPCGRAMRRLKQYGVPDDRIFVTGFPLPDENIGGLSMHILKRDLSQRLDRLDPTGHFSIIHGEEVAYYLGHTKYSTKKPECITVTYAVGGAGAQTEIARDVVRGLMPQIKAGKVKLNLVAGVRENVRQNFENFLNKMGLSNNEAVRVIHDNSFERYYLKFSDILHTTDVLWTKPSELSFYCGLGIPIIMAPCIGPHEAANKMWLQEIGAGIPQVDAKYCGEWLMDYLIDGRFAQAAWDGFLYARSMGKYKIQEVLATGTMTREISPVKR
ncbi:MAG TPA: hypothetical protein GXX36_06175 [Clostridiaceae bacterium]|nr:hypothetical protein [Clostridiaceae bacterium]